MKKMKLFASLLCSACLVAGSLAPIPVMADAVKVVTLGADLTEEQKNTMLRYFKVNTNEVQILYITNEDERAHLGAYVPLEQIGTRTVSCAYVKPTTSGGIKVRTANLNWVTCNMIATSLSTSGVKNCEVVAACPFEVSGTGALTGIQMAYETASGEQLDETKKEIATEEMVVTGNLAEQVGQNDATTIINQAKMQIIQGGIQDANEIYNIVINIADANGVSLSSDDIDTIVSLLEEIAMQDYDYEDVKDTLERVDENVSGDMEIIDEDDDVIDLGEDSIIDGLDESVLGNDVIAGSTEDPTVSEGVDLANEGDDDTVDLGDADSTDGEENPLSEQAQSMYDQAKQFCKGEYQGDTEALAATMGSEAYAPVDLDEETGNKLAQKVADIYYKILSEGTSAYVESEEDMYLTPELNMLNDELKKVFSIGDSYPDGEDILVNYAQDDKEMLYSDTIRFFETIYGESTENYDESYDESGDDTSDDGSYDETDYEEDYSEEDYEEDYGGEDSYEGSYEE